MTRLSSPLLAKFRDKLTGLSPRLQRLAGLQWTGRVFLEFAAGYLVGKLIADTAIRYTSPGEVASLVSGIGTVLICELYKKRYALRLIEVSDPLPRMRTLRKLDVATKAYKTLVGEFENLRRTLMQLQMGHELEENSYRDQMQIAKCLFSTHRSRFWATSLDLWSTFLQSNEAYIAAMADGPAEGSGEGAHEVGQEPPQRARIFVIRWQKFILDVTLNEASARLLVAHHLKAWMRRTLDVVPMRVYLLDTPEEDKLPFRKIIGDWVGRAALRQATHNS